jgi:ketosteroid isomerase-like protein
MTGDPGPADLWTAVSTLIDRHAVKGAIVEYLDAVERRDWSRVRDTFAPGAFVDYGTPGVEGADENVALLRAGVERLTSASTLLGMNAAVTVEVDTARSTSWAFTAHCPAGEAGGRARMSVVRYEDEWARQAGGRWRITRRIAHHELKGWLTLR